MTDRPLTMTYRLQFSEALGFAAAGDIVPHLARLGVSHLYASPITTARPGSTHGYDVVDPAAVSPALGGRAGLERLVERLHASRIGLILDIVPNHMAAHWANAAWMEALELGRTAPTAATFDIDWSEARVALPYLEAELGQCLAEGKIDLALDAPNARILVVHHDRRLPLRPRSAAVLFEEAGRAADAPDLVEAARAWPLTDRGDAGRAAVDAARSRLADALAATSSAGKFLEDHLHEIAVDQARLGVLLEAQHWRLEDWRSRSEAIGYRRFFEIDDLVGVRVETEAVFDSVHALPIDLVRTGLVDGLRVDHVDGLADPARYASDLRRAIGHRATLHVEKILIGEEHLRRWPVDGTTGYEALNWINGAFLDQAGYRAVRHGYHALDAALAAEGRVAQAKREMIDRSFGPDVARLVQLARQVPEQVTAAEEPPSEAALQGAICGIACAFPVYRSYFADHQPPADADVELVREALQAAFSEPPGDASAVDAVVRALFDRTDDAAAAFRTRFQQFTGALMAKGYEDTELYRNVAIGSANEVGGEIDDPAMSVRDFHARFADRQRAWPSALTPLSTHDTKRGADVRARLNVLSEMPEQWLAAVERWRDLAGPFVQLSPDGAAPDAVDQYILFQSLLGAWPIDADRVREHVVKVLREAKRRSDWLAPDETYEQAAVRFATALVDDPAAEAFRTDFLGFLREVVRAGRVNGFCQAVLQMTVPGVPDVFQGTERWDLTLVDPDNRRPVDWAEAAALDFDARPADVRDDEQGLCKGAVYVAIGAVRRKRPELFREGGYQPLAIRKGAEASDAVVAFARVHGGAACITVAAVRGHAAGNGAVGEAEIEVPPTLRGRYRRVLSGDTVELGASVPLPRLISREVPAGVFVRETLA